MLFLFFEHIQQFVFIESIEFIYQNEKKMKIRDLEYLVALSKYQHFRKAAEACFVSQPTLSGQIRKLEEDLGVMLLERTSRKVIFTETGMLLVRQAQKVLDEVRLLKDMADQQDEIMSGVLHLGVIPTLSAYLLPHIVLVLRDAFPDLELFIHEGQTYQLVQDLTEGKLDCLVLASVKETESLKEIHLFDEPMLLAVSKDHPWKDKEGVEMDALRGETLLMLSDGHCLRNQAMDYCFVAGANEDLRYQASSLETLRNMVAANTGITFIPQLAVPKEKGHDGVVYIKATHPEPKREITLSYRPGSPLKMRFERLASLIAQTMKEVLS